jgi:hypothetical protein
MKIAANTIGTMMVSHRWRSDCASRRDHSGRRFEDCRKPPHTK